MAESFLGILMLDTAFPRIPGDAGNTVSYPFPAKTHIVAGAAAHAIVSADKPSRDLTNGFKSAARQLEAEGAIALISTCGFLIRLQDEIAASVKIPVMLSALSLYPMLNTAFCGRRFGILTASQSALSPAVLAQAGIADDKVAIAGLEDRAAFADPILHGLSDRFIAADIEAAAVAAAMGLKEAHPGLAGLLLECTNLPPYATAIHKATGLPVFSIIDAAAMLWRGRMGTAAIG